MTGSRHQPAAPAQAAGAYRERPVPPALAARFETAWLHALPAGPDATVLVVPDGRIDLLWRDGAPSIAGPDREPQPTTLRAGTAVVGLRFRPAAAVAWLRVPAGELLNRRVGLDEVAPRAARRLVEAVGDRHEPAAVTQALQEALAREHMPADGDAALMRRAFELIAAGPPDGRPLVPWLVAALETSERGLRRRFLDAFGYGPKTLDRILRFQRFLGLARRAAADGAAGLAVEAGFADQPHLTREVRRLSGHTPREVLRLLAR